MVAIYWKKSSSLAKCFILSINLSASINHLLLLILPCTLFMFKFLNISNILYIFSPLAASKILFSLFQVQYRDYTNQHLLVHSHIHKSCLLVSNYYIIASFVTHWLLSSNSHSTHNTITRRNAWSKKHVKICLLTSWAKSALSTRSRSFSVYYSATPVSQPEMGKSLGGDTAKRTDLRWPRG